MSDATPLEFAMAKVLRDTDDARAKAEAELRAAKYAAEQARSLAIDDAVKVVRERIEHWQRVIAATNEGNDPEGEMMRSYRRSETETKLIVNRLEALKGGYLRENYAGGVTSFATIDEIFGEEALKEAKP